MKKLAYLKDVVSLRLNQEKCNGCGMCLIVCPHAVFGLDNGHALIKNRDACMECGACMRNCQAGAITVRPGVGCAYGILLSRLRGKKDNCECGGVDVSCCESSEK